MKLLGFLIFMSLIALGNAHAAVFDSNSGPISVKCTSPIDPGDAVHFKLKLDQNGIPTILQFLFVSPNQETEAQQVIIKENVGSRDPKSILPISFLNLFVDGKDMVFASNDGQNYFLHVDYDSSNPQSYTCDIAGSRSGVIVSN